MKVAQYDTNDKKQHYSSSFQPFPQNSSRALLKGGLGIDINF